MREGESSTKGYVFDGTKIVEVPGSIVIMIEDDDDLTALAAKVGAGTIAYTAGWKAAWQLDTDGETWQQFIGTTE